MISVGLLVGQFVIAYLTLDLFFRHIDLAPARLRDLVRRTGFRFALVAMVCCAGTAIVQWRLGGWGGMALAVLDPVPWWLLWRFGLRKQLTFLFKDDGGRPVTRENPDL